MFWLPMEELRSENGHVVRGLQRGVGSFGMSTAAAVVDLAQRFVGVVNVSIHDTGESEKRRKGVAEETSQKGLGKITDQGNLKKNLNAKKCDQILKV